MANVFSNTRLSFVILFALMLIGAFFAWSGLALAQSPTVIATRTLSTTPSFTATRALTATQTLTSTRTLTPTLTATFMPTPAATSTATPTFSPTATLSPTLTPTQTPLPTATPIRYPLSMDPNVLSIESLRARPYGGGGIKITKVVLTNDAFKQVLIEYPSDGLKITGTMNIPRGVGPFPVVVLDHGYFKPAEYKTGDGTRPAADSFARHGYLTIASDYRCYAGSQCAANPLYVGYAIDVLNLIAQLPSLGIADTARVGIWGHSMGGGITLRVLAITDTVKVGSLYGALSADDEVHYCWLIGCRTPLAPTREPRASPRVLEADPDFVQGPIATPQASASNDPLARLHEIFLKSSPSRHLSEFNTPLIIHHGEADDIVPIEWSIGLADTLNSYGKTAVLYTYPGETHIFAGWGWQLFMARTLSFFDDYLNPRDTPITADKRVLQQERLAEESSY